MNLQDILRLIQPQQQGLRPTTPQQHTGGPSGQFPTNPFPQQQHTQGPLMGASSILSPIASGMGVGSGGK